MKEFYEKTGRWMDGIPILLLFFVIVPLIGVSFFDQPSTDDFDYADLTLGKGYWNAQIYNYVSWTGRYFSTALLTASPLVFRAFVGYKLLAIFWILSLLVIVHWLWGKILPELDRMARVGLTSFSLTIYLLQLPAPNQTLFWMCGAITYQGANLLTLLFWGFWIAYFRTGQKMFFGLSFLCIFGIVGSNETSMFLLDASLLIALLFDLLKNRKVRPELVSWGLFALCLSLVVLAAPGNANRGSFFPMKHHLGYSLKMSIDSGLSNLSVWIRGIRGMVWIELFLVGFIYRRVVLERGTRTLPVLELPVAFLGCFFAAFFGCFPAFWATGNPPAGRTDSVAYFYFLSALFCLFIALTSRAREWGGMRKVRFPWGISAVSICLGLFLIVTRTNNVTQAYDDLLSGRAQRYNEQMVQRRQNIHDFMGDLCVLGRIQVVPRSLYFEDISEDVTDWKNLALNKYFGKKCVLAASSSERKRSP